MSKELVINGVRIITLPPTACMGIYPGMEGIPKEAFSARCITELTFIQLINEYKSDSIALATQVEGSTIDNIIWVKKDSRMDKELFTTEDEFVNHCNELNVDINTVEF